MIPNNITKEHILSAINKIDIDGVPPNREATKFSLLHNDKFYPPKYTVSIANVFANDFEHPATEFSGGEETNNFLTSLGFVIMEHSSEEHKKHLSLNFHKDMLNIYNEAKKIGYNASRFKQMVANEGGFNVAKKFIKNSTPSDGFVSLWEMKRLDLTVESLILKEEYRALFNDEERNIVINRLKEYGYEINNQLDYNTWIFQGNPNVFDINNYVKDNKYIWWSLRQEHFYDDIKTNDDVFLWRSDGGNRGSGGIIAKCKVVSEPQERADDSSSKNYWYSNEWTKSYLAIKLEVIEFKLEENSVSRMTLLEHPILKDLLIHKLRQQTNYLISKEHASELNKLWNISIDKSQYAKDIESELAEEDEFYSDGTVRTYFGKRYERNPLNRAKAIEIHGLNCVCCGFNFEKVYGERGKDFIEIHHIKPLSTIKEETIINPETDLVPVCSNCHRMIHRKKDDVLTIEEVKEIMSLS